MSFGFIEDDLIFPDICSSKQERISMLRLKIPDIDLLNEWKMQIYSLINQIGELKLVSDSSSTNTDTSAVDLGIVHYFFNIKVSLGDK